MISDDVLKLIARVEGGQATSEEKLLALKWVNANLAAINRKLDHEKEILRASLAAHSA